MPINAMMATMEKHGDLHKKAIESGEQAAQQEGATRSKLDAKKEDLTALKLQEEQVTEEIQRLSALTESTAAELEETKTELQECMSTIEQLRSCEHEIKALHRTLAESQSNLRSDIEQARAAVSTCDTERLASERCARSSAETVSEERQTLESELSELQAEIAKYSRQLEDERASLEGETDKTRQEHQEKVDEVLKQLEEERHALKGEVEKTRDDHLRAVEETRRQLEEERRAHSGTLDEHKGRLLERERGAGVLEGKVHVLTSEVSSLREQLAEIEKQAMASERTLAEQSHENDQYQQDLIALKAELEAVKAGADDSLRKQAEEHEKRLEEELDCEDRRKQPKCGCSVQ